MSDSIVVPDILRRESRTFLQYIREAFPWAKAKDDATRLAVLSAAQADAEAVTRLGHLMQKKHLPMPALGAFPTAFTESNFVAVSFLVPKLIAKQRQAIDELAGRVPSVDDADIRELLEGLLAQKRRHLSDLETLVGPQAA